jgi:lipopolysaccharide biosynthesis protein
MCHNKYPNAHIIHAVKGCDTGAFLLQIQAMLLTGKTYTYIFKIHTKSNNPVYPHWKEDLLHVIAGSPRRVKKVIHMFKKHKRIGMIGCKRWILEREINYQNFDEICQRNNISRDGQFIGGTIFWIRFDVIKQFFTSLNFDFETEYNLCEPGKPMEPSNTHAWERIYGLIVSQCGYTISGAP